MFLLNEDNLDSVGLENKKKEQILSWVGFWRNLSSIRFEDARIEEVL